MIRTREWYKHAYTSIQRIKEFRLTSPLGYYSSPEEYVDFLEDFGKLMYDINRMPQDVADKFVSAKTSFEIFKNEISNLCDILLEKVKDHDHDTPKDEKRM